jgi:hypothetical protein
VGNVGYDAAKRIKGRKRVCPVVSVQGKMLNANWRHSCLLRIIGLRAKQK